MNDTSILPATSTRLEGAVFPVPPAPCSAFAWCASRVPGHTVHQSAPVPLHGDTGRVPYEGEDRVLFAETDPDTGSLLYGPVLGGGDADEPVGHARVIAAQLRVAAARLEELAVVAEHGVSPIG